MNIIDIIDINSEAAINNLSDEARDKIDSVQQNLDGIAHALNVIADPDSRESKSAYPFDLTTFSREDARAALAELVAKL